MNAIDAARSVLPWWVGWGGVIVYLPFAFLFSLTCSSLLTRWALRPLWRQEPDTWVERARLAFPGFVVSHLACPLIFCCWLGAMAGAVHGLFTRVPLGILTLLGIVAGCAGTGLVAWRVERRVRLPGLRLGRWLRSLAAHWLVFRPHLLVIILCVVLLPSDMTPEVVVILIGAACLLAFLGCGGGFDLARLLGLAWPASERLQAVVAAASKHAGMTPPVAFELSMNYANAVAFVIRRRLAFTSPALELLSDRELEAICAHELGHLDESGLVKSTRFLSVFLLLPLAAAKPVIGWLGPEAAFACALVSLGGILAVTRLSRHMEFRADRMAKAEESDAGIFAAALERIYAYNLVPAVLCGWGQTHPNLYDRLLSLGFTPPYPRPAAPARRPIMLAAAAAMVLCLVVLVGFLFGKFFVYLSQPDNEKTLLILLALGDGRAAELRHLAAGRHRQGNDEDAIVLYQAAGALDEYAVYDLVCAAILLANSERCDQAEACLREAGRRLDEKPQPDLTDEQTVMDAREVVANCRVRKKLSKSEQ
jgi:Zn-dependent protease with chaperone function